MNSNRFRLILVIAKMLEQMAVLNRLKKIISVSLLMIVSSLAYNQENVELKNPSFEGKPTKGVISYGMPTAPPPGWYDCGLVDFPGETPPDIHPNNYWENTQMPSNGDTYLGLVVRSNESWECVSQRLTNIIRKDICYDFTVDLTRSNNYWSLTRDEDSRMANYRTPAVLRIWGGTGYCDRDQLLAESAPVNNDEWKSYSFTIEPKTNYRFLTIEAFYKIPVLEPYNGHVLIDNFSSFIAYPCNEDPPILASVNEELSAPVKNKAAPPHKNRKVKKPTVVEDSSPSEVASVAPDKKIMTELNRNTIKTGQKIKIKNLYFKADSTAIEHDSHAVLDELYQFLADNEDITVEIGGHTNLIPPTDYCDSLSNVRAKEVSEYLIRKGIRSNRIRYKGYGKRNPVVKSKSNFANRKNQRVEIKILSIG